MDLEPFGGLRHRRPGARPRHQDDSPSTRTGVPGVPDRDLREPRRLPPDLRDGDADLPARPGGRRAVPDAARLRERPGGVHQHRPVDAYRGAGTGGTYQLERVVDQAAELGHRPGGVRRATSSSRRSSRTDAACSGLRRRQLPRDARQADEISDYAGFAARRAEAARRGRLRGFGFSTWVECCGLAPSQLIGALGRPGRALRGGDGPGEPDRRHHVFTGTHSHGQGHETSLRADRRRPAGHRRG